MLAHVRRSVAISAVLLAVTFAYAFLGTGVAQLFFSRQANGSLTADGSPLIGQDWSLTRCPGHPDGSCVFQGRPDNAGPYAATTCVNGDSKCTATSGGDNPLAAASYGRAAAGGESAASNLGPRSEALLTDTRQLVQYWRSRGVDPTPDLVTTSGSGYDPDISPADALAQVPMVAGATGVSPAQLDALIRDQTHGAQWGFLGSSYIDVLHLNQALAAIEQH